MSGKPENEYPTLRDFRDRLSDLVERGLGDLPAQILILPDSSMQAIARQLYPSSKDDAKPALIIELDSGETPLGRRLPVSVISMDRMRGGSGMLSTKTQ